MNMARTRYRFVGEYLAFVRQAFATTAAGGTVKLSWCNPSLDATGWRREFRSALNNRINAKGGVEPMSRYCPPNLNPAYNYSGFVRDQQRLKDIRRRVRVYQFETRAVRERFGHLLSSYDED